MKHWVTIMMACVYNLSTLHLLSYASIHSIHARQHEINKIFHLIHQYTIEIIFYTSVHMSMSERQVGPGVSNPWTGI